MAQCEIKTIREDEGITTLELTPEEAVAVQIILYRVSGCTTTSLRKHADDISNALGKLGITDFDANDELFSIGRSMIFKNDTLPKKD